ncbi:CAP domain-containing protein [Halodurantibacterium flavum]|uniref:CAP domain-containing protein n=1 Tax=Halodurantibacterium flavum TaxID=1382802 RepID=A0ABW4S2I5_9RHOB
MIKSPEIRRLVFTTALAGTFAVPAFAQETGDLPALRLEALDLTNAAREEAGLPELAPSDLLDQAAQDHAADMLARGYHDHVSPDGETPFDRFIAAGGNTWSVSGENIATCEGCSVPPDAARVTAFHDGWMQSPGHRENILSEGFDSFGFGIVGEGSRVYAVQTFSGAGAGDGITEGLTPEAAREAALAEVNEARAAENLDPLERSDALDTAAGRVLENTAGGPDALPENIFDLLPEGSTGWTRLALQVASVGGSGATITRDNIAMIISDWAAAGEAGQGLGGPDASHMGFAVEAAGDGRTSAAAVFAGRQ